LLNKRQLSCCARSIWRMTTAVSSKKQYRARLARDTKCCASLQKQVSLAHFVLQFAFTKVSLGNSNLPTARDLLRQAEATLTKAITAYLDVNEASNVNLNASMMNGWATNCVFWRAIAHSSLPGPFLGITPPKKIKARSCWQP